MTTYSTLLDAFAPPDGLFGRGAVFVAMSATEDFLEQAMETFTRLRPAQRETLGGVVAYLLLDAHQSESRTTVLAPGAIPGLHELYPRRESVDRLHHAKLALLGFSASRSGEVSRIRLVVMTANLTAASASRQLELVWVVECGVQAPESDDDATDVGEAAEFVEGLLRRYHREEASLRPAERTLTRRLDDVLGAARTVGARARGKRAPRFFHSGDGRAPMYDQIVGRLAAMGDGWNLLLCGSGFFEQASDHGAPTVLEKLQNKLSRVLTNNPRRVAIANPDRCGALAGWSAEENGWALRPAIDPDGAARALHAKFILAGRFHNGHVTAGALYLGSSNLSRQGLGLTRTPNLECGVVFSLPERIEPGRLFWDGKTATEPIEWEGGDGEEPEGAHDVVEAPPILLATLARGGGVLTLHWSEDAADREAMIVIPGTPHWARVVRSDDRVVVPAGTMMVTLEVRRSAEARVFRIPVVDAEGRVCWKPPRFDDVQGAMEALLDFPLRPPEAADEDDEGSSDSPGEAVARPRPEAREREYELLLAAELVERIAEIQTELPEAMLEDWVDHLERHLLHAFPVAVRQAWARLGIPIFAHLKARALRHPELPDRYWDVLDRAASAWGMK